MEFVPKIGEDKLVYAFLKTEDIGFNKDGKYDDYLSFYVHTYSKLSKVKNAESPDNYLGWQYVFGYVNMFFNAQADPDHPEFVPLTVEDKILIAKTFALIKKDINEYQEQDDIFQITTLAKKISDRLLELDVAIDLCPKLFNFVVAYIPIGLMKNAGARPQDRPELTFYENDVKVVTTLTVLCKLLSPIFGSIIAITKKLISTNIKILHCAGILTGIINHRYSAETEKLKFYIEHVTRQNHKEDDGSALIYGYDMSSLSYDLYCQLLVRQLVNVNLAVIESNLMAYIMVSAKRSVSTTQNNVSNSPTKDRTAIAAESDDEGNIAQLETDSMTSKKTSDIDALISAAVLPTITKTKAMYEIEDDEYDECMKFYMQSPLQPSPINEQLNSLLYGKDFGGSLGIKMLRFNEYSMISVLTQMILFQHSSHPAFRTLAHLITAQPSIGTMAVNDELNDNIIWLQVSASTAFRNCKQRFLNSTVAIKNKEWENHIQAIIKSVTVNKYVYNTAPFLWDYAGEENHNGKLIHLDKDTLVAYCNFYDWYMTVCDEAARHGGIK